MGDCLAAVTNAHFCIHPFSVPFLTNPEPLDNFHPHAHPKLAAAFLSFCLTAEYVLSR